MKQKTRRSKSESSSTDVKLIAKKLDSALMESVVVLIPAEGNADKKLTPDTQGLPRELAQFVNEVFATSENAPGSDGALFREVRLGDIKHLGLVRMPAVSEIRLEDLRTAMAHAQKLIASLKATKVQVLAGALPPRENVEHLGSALAEGLILASYNFSMYKKDNGKKVARTSHIEILTAKDPSDLQKGLNKGQLISECVNFSRSLGDRPGNLMTPTMLADEAAKAARGTSLKVTAWGRSKIEKENMGCFLGVSLGSSQEPKFIIMEYRGATKNKKPVCFVGKGLTFDSGGISIKPSGGMEEMKFDMCGGANVIGTMLAIARLKLKINAIGFVPATENMPGPSANKPGDICFARNGVSVEVNNTDAEGRLILADVLVYASEQEPQVIVDIATLTGAMSVALGNVHTGYFCRDEELATAVKAAADHTGEPVWRMPMVADHLKDMKGTYGDLSNMSSGKGAGSATAAAFLGEFVDKKIPWAHFDIAGTGWHTGNRQAYNPKKGASGVMIRTFVELAKSYE